MHDLTADPALPLSPHFPDVAERPGVPFYVPISEDLAVRLNTHTILDQRWSRGELDEYRGEYVVAAPDGTVLEYTTRGGDHSLINARDRARVRAAHLGIPPGQLTHYYVPPLE